MPSTTPKGPHPPRKRVDPFGAQGRLSPSGEMEGEVLLPACDEARTVLCSA